MIWQPHWFAVLLFGLATVSLATVGCSLNPEHGSNRSNSYVVHGQRYQVLASADGFVERGIASWYGRKFHGKRTSSGERYNMYAMTAAHKYLPIPSTVEVTNLENGRHVVVRINDRGPFVDNRIIDLSYAAAKQLGMLKKGTASVEIRVINNKPGTQLASAAPVAATTYATDAQSDAAFYVQVGAFTERTNACRLQKQLKAAQLAAPVQIEPVNKRGTTYYRVRLGPLHSRNAAGLLARRLADYGISDSRIDSD